MQFNFVAAVRREHEEGNLRLDLVKNLAASNPFIPGIPKSKIIKSGEDASVSAMAPRPLMASIHTTEHSVSSRLRRVFLTAG